MLRCPVNALAADAQPAFHAWLRSQLPHKPKAIIVRSGWHDDTSDEAEPLFLPGPRATWQGFMQTVETACAEHAITPVLEPRANDVVSDTPGLLGLVRSAPRWKILFDPALLLTPAMQPQLDDHLQRYAQVAQGLHDMHALYALRPGAKHFEAICNAAHDLVIP
jgi:hypothetical protein